jgi:hypothetical protein
MIFTPFLHLGTRQLFTKRTASAARGKKRAKEITKLALMSYPSPFSLLSLFKKDTRIPKLYALVSGPPSESKGFSANRTNFYNESGEDNERERGK